MIDVRHSNSTYLYVVSIHRRVTAADESSCNLHNTRTRSTEATNWQRKVLPNN